MRELTRKVLRPWNSMGSTPFLSLALKGEKVKTASILRIEALERQPHFYQIITSPWWLPARANSHKRTSVSGGPKSATVWDFFLLFFFSFFLNLFFFFFLPVLEKHSIETVSNHTLSSHHVERHTLYFSKIIKPCSQLASLCLSFSQTFDILSYLETSSTFSWFMQDYWGHPTSKSHSVTQMVKFSCVWVSRGCLGRRNNTLL